MAGYYGGYYGGYGAYPELDSQPPNYLAVADQAQDFAAEQQLMPAQLQYKKNQLAAANTGLGNEQLTQAANDALAADPQDAPKIWDQQMSKLAEQGVPGAAQYIGHYRPDLANKVQSVFSGHGVPQTPGVDPSIAQQVFAQMTPTQMQQSVSNFNMAVEGFNKIRSEQDWHEEVAKLKAAGMDIDKVVGQSGNWQTDYAKAYQVLQKQMPMRDAMQQHLANLAFGFPEAAPPQQLKEGKPGDVLYNQQGQIVSTLPGAQNKDNYEFIGADKTGGRPIIFNKATGEYTDPAGNPVSSGEANAAAYQSFASKMSAIENGTGNPAAKNPNSSATGNGQFVNATWLQTARAAVPGLKGVPDAQLLAMRNMPGFSQDITAAYAQENAQQLQKAGLPVTGATLGMAHQLGAGDAEKVLQAPNNTPLSKILSPAVIKANPQYANMTNTQYAHQMIQQLGNDPIGAPAQGSSPFSSDNPDAELQNADPSSQEILGQTGLTYPAFMLLTGTGSQLARDKASRTNAIKVADEFAKQRGVDISTFKSQYQAANDILEFNMKRYNQTRVMENEILGTVQALQPVAKAALDGNLTVENLADLWAGKQINNPVVQQYKAQLKYLRDELAGYSAALEGRTGGGGNARGVTDNDRRDAEETIANGISARGLNGIRDSVLSQTGKMRGVLQRSIDDTRKSVWDQFGVGQNYRAVYPANIPPKAAALLHQHPEWRDHFDEQFGSGQANLILGGH